MDQTPFVQEGRSPHPCNVKTCMYLTSAQAQSGEIPLEWWYSVRPIVCQHSAGNLWQTFALKMYQAHLFFALLLQQLIWK